MKKWSLPCLVKNALRGGSATKPVSSDKGWTGCAVKPIKHAVSLEQICELKLLLNGPHCTSSCKLLPRVLYNVTWLQNLVWLQGNGPHLKKGHQKLLHEVWVISVLFFNHRIKTFETRWSFGHWVPPIPQKSPFVGNSLLLTAFQETTGTDICFMLQSHSQLNT